MENKNIIKNSTNWNLITVNKITDVIKGNSFKSKFFNSENEGLPLIRIRDLGKSKTQIFYNGDYDESYIIKKGDLLISMDGEFNLFKWNGPNGLLNQRVCKISSKDEKKLDNEFLYYILKQPLKRLEMQIAHTTVKHLLDKHFKILEIPLPSIKEQKKIVDIIKKAEKLKEWRAEADNLTDEYLKSLFFKMFGDPFTNEYNWELKKLGDVSDVVSGVTKGRKLQNKETVYAPYLRVANVQDGYLDLSEIKEIEVLFTDIEKYKLLSGDILLTEGGDPDKLGRGAVWYNQIKDCIHQNHIFRVRINNRQLNAEYLSKLIGSIYGKIYFLRSAKQTTGIATINSRQLKRFPVLIPPIQLQNQFANIIKQTEYIKTQQNQSRQQIDNLFNVLMQKAFNGELLC